MDAPRSGFAALGPEDPCTDAERDAMSIAIDLARLGLRGENPLVGAVILDAQEQVLSTGYHRGAGHPHAEVEAIDAAAVRGADLRGCTMVVSLEPCNHHGRTGPCTEAITGAGMSRVVYAVADPHMPAAGGGAALRRAGLDVVAGLLKEQAAAVNERWLRAVAAHRPFITLHLAQTLDAQIAAADGTSQWISGPEARADSHRMRRRIGAILVGSQTVLADNPRLTAREADGTPAPEQPLRVAMGRRTPPADAAIRGTDGRFRHLPTREPLEAAQALYREGVRHLMVEGGSHVSGAFLRSGLVDDMYVYLAPSFLGRGIPALADLGISTLSEAHLWRWDTTGEGFAVVCGDDVRLHVEPAGDGTAEG